MIHGASSEKFAMWSVRIACGSDVVDVFDDENLCFEASSSNLFSMIGNQIDSVPCASSHAQARALYVLQSLLQLPSPKIELNTNSRRKTKGKNKLTSRSSHQQPQFLQLQCDWVGPGGFNPENTVSFLPFFCFLDSIGGCFDFCACSLASKVVPERSSVGLARSEWTGGNSVDKTRPDDGFISLVMASEDAPTVHEPFNTNNNRISSVGIPLGMGRTESGHFPSVPAPVGKTTATAI
ncbi:hypothetical protein QBC45DRAFT_487875 [Copromyces sp. CBS 386.78]|nr:hypothetical protein QBC45DRAFT_487875 [Copromyces sp. CBS 386.78]